MSDELNTTDGGLEWGPWLPLYYVNMAGTYLGEHRKAKLTPRQEKWLLQEYGAPIDIEQCRGIRRIGEGIQRG